MFSAGINRLQKKREQKMRQKLLAAKKARHPQLVSLFCHDVPLQHEKRSEPKP
ncbi:hypothetical protein HMPREF1248_1119 [Coriobacteriaceae bacterium BV3Ac1]|nr:hypothetical protein HMPREF1248_1119 [Coriobacteriaceae bacterium BV3Ac1]